MGLKAQETAAQAAAPADAGAALVFAASTASVPEAPQWTLSQPVEDDAPAAGFAHFDPVIAEDSSATRWDAVPPMQALLDTLDTGADADAGDAGQASVASSALQLPPRPAEPCPALRAVAGLATGPGRRACR